MNRLRARQMMDFLIELIMTLSETKREEEKAKRTDSCLKCSRKLCCIKIRILTEGTKWENLSHLISNDLEFRPFQSKK